MKRIILICVMFFMLLPEVTFAQTESSVPYKNIVKLNTIALALNNVSLFYERSLNEHWTVLAGAGYRWGGGIPKAFALGNVIVSSETGGIRGFKFAPELRYYFNFCECGGSPSGFYTGLYGRYTHYYGDLTFNVWTGSEYVDVATTSDLREYGIGLQLGYQFVFKERFLIDLMFAGPRLARNKMNFSLDSDYLDEVVPIIEEELNEKLEWLGIDPISIEPSRDLEARFGFRYLRYGVSFGFLF